MDYKVFIEIPIGSSVKYEVDETTGELKVDRFLYNSFAYPFNYGYIKDTKGGDGDPMDAVVPKSIHSTAVSKILKMYPKPYSIRSSISLNTTKISNPANGSKSSSGKTLKRRKI